MSRFRGFAQAMHPAPAVLVWLLMTALAWRVGWRGTPLVVASAAVLVGQASVGWSNDAVDASRDRRAGRLDKPVVRGDVEPSALWAAGVAALVASCALSWSAGGALGGSFHVLFLSMAWLYNLALSRTVWSWLPYAIGFGALPAFLYVGLDGAPPPWWTVAAFATVATSAHLANALRDIEPDRAAGTDGLVIRLGSRRATLLCWGLLIAGTTLLAAVTWPSSPATAALLAGIVVAAVLWSVVRPSHVFRVLLAVVAVEALAVLVTPAW